MFKKLLVPVDGSACGERAAAFALRLARKISGSIVYLHVVQSGQGERAEVTQRLGQALLNDWTRQSDNRGVPSSAQLITADVIAPRIAQAAKDLRCDTIVMGTHARRGLAHMHLGSVAERVIREADVPVLLIRDQQRDVRNVRQLLVAVDGGDSTAQTLSVAVAFAHAHGAMIDVTTVIPDRLPVFGEYNGPIGYEALQREMETGSKAILEDAVRQLHGLGVEPRRAECTRSGMDATRVGDVIVRTAREWQADMVVVGSHGHGGVDQWLLGSTAERVVHRADVPVLLVRPASTSEGDQAGRTLHRTTTDAPAPERTGAP